MHDAVAMDVLHSCQQLLHEAHSLLLVQSPLLDDVFEELSALRVLHDQVDAVLGLNDLVELRDVGMPEYLQDADLPGDSFDVCLVDYLILLQHLDGHPFASGNVDGEVDLSESALADDFACVGGWLLSLYSARVFASVGEWAFMGQ